MKNLNFLEHKELLIKKFGEELLSSEVFINLFDKNKKYTVFEPMIYLPYLSCCEVYRFDENKTSTTYKIGDVFKITFKDYYHIFVIIQDKEMCKYFYDKKFHNNIDNLKDIIVVEDYKESKNLTDNAKISFIYMPKQDTSSIKWLAEKTTSYFANFINEKLQDKSIKLEDFDLKEFYSRLLNYQEDIYKEYEEVKKMKIEYYKKSITSLIDKLIEI